MNKAFKRKAMLLTQGADLIIVQALRMAQYAYTTHKTIIDIEKDP